MNKQELLFDLEKKEWCAFVEIPELLEVKKDGTNWYVVNIRDESDSKVGTYRNVHFYVVDEGGAGEVALYKDQEPDETQNRVSKLKQWLFIEADNNPDDFKGIQILWLSEKLNMIIYSILDGTPLKQKVFYVRRGHGLRVEIQDFNIELLKSI